MDLLGWRQHLHVFAIHFMKTYLCILVFFHFNVFFPKKQCSSTPLEPGPSLLRPSETCWLSRLAKKASFFPLKFIRTDLNLI